MKKIKHISTAPRTTIGNIAAIGYELSDEHLRLVAGGRPKTQTTPASITNAGETDTWKDEQSDG
jgi:hypothetical protein